MKETTEKKQQGTSVGELRNFYRQVRNATHEICAPLYPEDFCVQPGGDVSPPKWHLAHTTWFFETFILKPFFTGYKEFHPHFNTLFNSYYNSLGRRIENYKRGDLSRPTLQTIYQYREYVDRSMDEFLQSYSGNRGEELQELITLGLHHEQQHQELLLTDIKYLLSVNLMQPAYREEGPSPNPENALPLSFVPVDEGVYKIGHQGDGFCYDNETPRHKTYIHAFNIGNRLITNEEFCEFIEDGGYEDFRFWLSDGWDYINQVQRKHPLFWEKEDGEWFEYTLNGREKLRKNAPVTHINFYEADAFAVWRGKRLLTEQEWEVAARVFAPDKTKANFYEHGYLHPAPVNNGASNNNCHQLLGDAWEWTQSAYTPYPGYQPPEGALGEYNGKFMVNQKVLRGGSCATPSTHIRYTYRNFFHPPRDWQFTGIRLAE